jgi:hypothetical protein
LNSALQQLFDALQQSGSSEGRATGPLVFTFRVEPDGMIRIVMRRDTTSFEGPESVVDSFIHSTMKRAWRFPQSAGPMVVDARLEVSRSQRVRADHLG